MISSRKLLPISLLVCLFHIVTFAVPSATIQVSQGEDITIIDQAVDSNCLVVLDIDDTLIRSKTTLGSPACFYKLRDRFVLNSTLSREEVHSAFLKFDLALQQHVEFTLVDDRIAEIIERFQSQGIPVIGLTNRPKILADVTNKIMNSLFIELGKSIPYTHEEFCLQKPALYDHGVLYVGDHNTKASVLDYFIHNLLPNMNQYTKIIFVDDKEMHVRNIENYARENDYDFFGLYYLKEKNKQKTVDLDLAMEQIKQLFVFSKEKLVPSGIVSLIDDPKILELFYNKMPSETGHFLLVGTVIPDHHISHE